MIRSYTWLLALAAFAQASWADPLHSSIDVQNHTHQEAVVSQGKVDALADKTVGLAAEYRNILRHIDNTRIYNQQLERLIQSQKGEMISLDKQLVDIEITQREIVPLLLRMVETLEQFVALDIPFLAEERRDRLANLRSMMDRADVSVAEKYRRVMEAYQVETEYGRTIEAYRGEMESKRTVDFLRFGRVALYYLTLDGKEAGQWDRKTGRWQVLPEEYNTAVTQGLRIAHKQAAPDLLVLPVATPEGTP